jgi:hypothetical protein
MANTPSSRRSYSLVDLGAAAAVALAVGGVVWSPKLSGAIARATGAMQPVIVTVDVRGVPAADAPSLVKSIEEEGNVSVVIRNQPHGTVAVKQVLPLERRISTVSPDGRVVSAPDPNQKTFGSFDARLVLEGQGRKTAGGVVFGNQTIKIGAPVELEGSRFRFGGSVTDLQLGQR